jgi:hypothetical protein
VLDTPSGYEAGVGGTTSSRGLQRYLICAAQHTVAFEHVISVDKKAYADRTRTT